MDWVGSGGRFGVAMMMVAEISDGFSEDGLAAGFGVGVGVGVGVRAEDIFFFIIQNF
jgi:hypothetical protein